MFSTTPIFVSSTANPDDETDQQIQVRQKKFAGLPQNIRWKLSSFETSAKIQLLGQKYGFRLLNLANITRLIREYYFGEVQIKDFPQEIEKRMSINLLTAQEITRFLKSEILDWDPWREYLASFPKTTARELIMRFPKVANQEITNSYLEFKDRPEDAFKPTIKNWLRDYILRLGQTAHSSVDRMNYLFRSENTKNLTSTDREKLGIILKSFDENTPLPIDVENNEVVFEIHEEQPVQSKVRPFPSASSAGSLPVGRQAQGQTLTAQGDFIRPYSQPVAKPPAPPRPVQNNFVRTFQPPEIRPAVSNKPVDQDSTFPLSDKSSNSSESNLIQFVNPYPAPETHEMGTAKPEMAGEAPVKLKGFSEGAPKNIQSSTFPLSGKPSNSLPVGRQAQSSNFSAPKPPKPYAPSRPKNVIYPHYEAGREEKPEPRIDGNVVDLSG